MNITGVDFAIIPSNDFAASCRFYEETLGLDKSKQWGDMPGQEYETGSLTLAVMESEAFGLEFRPHSHPIAFQVDDVPAAREELEAKGITFAADTIDSGVCHMAPFHDPCGNALMLHHRYAPNP